MVKVKRICKHCGNPIHVNAGFIGNDDGDYHKKCWIEMGNEIPEKEYTTKEWDQKKVSKIKHKINTKKPVKKQIPAEIIQALIDFTTTSSPGGALQLKREFNYLPANKIMEMAEEQNKIPKGSGKKYGDDGIKLIKQILSLSPGEIYNPKLPKIPGKISEKIPKIDIKSKLKMTKKQFKELVKLAEKIPEPDGWDTFYDKKIWPKLKKIIKVIIIGGSISILLTPLGMAGAGAILITRRTKRLKEMKAKAIDQLHVILREVIGRFIGVAAVYVSNDKNFKRTIADLKARMNPGKIKIDWKKVNVGELIMSAILIADDLVGLAAGAGVGGVGGGVAGVGVATAGTAPAGAGIGAGIGTALAVADDVIALKFIVNSVTGAVSIANPRDLEIEYFNEEEEEEDLDIRKRSFVDQDQARDWADINKVEVVDVVYSSEGGEWILEYMGYPVTYNPAKRVKLTPAEDRAWEEYFTFYQNEGYSDDEADELAWADMKKIFPRLKAFEGIKNKEENLFGFPISKPTVRSYGHVDIGEEVYHIESLEHKGILQDIDDQGNALVIWYGADEPEEVHASEIVATNPKQDYLPANKTKFKIVKNKWDEYEVQVFVNGKIVSDRTYFTDSKDDAESTLTIMKAEAESNPSRIAFSAVLSRGGKGFAIGKVLEFDSGYWPQHHYGTFDTYEEAWEAADNLNDYLGLTRKEAYGIIGTSFRKNPEASEHLTRIALDLFGEKFYDLPQDKQDLALSVLMREAQMFGRAPNPKGKAAGIAKGGTAILKAYQELSPEKKEALMGLLTSLLSKKATEKPLPPPPTNNPKYNYYEQLEPIVLKHVTGWQDDFTVYDKKSLNEASVFFMGIRATGTDLLTDIQLDKWYQEFYQEAMKGYEDTPGAESYSHRRAMERIYKWSKDRLFRQTNNRFFQGMDGKVAEITRTQLDTALDLWIDRHLLTGNPTQAGAQKTAQEQRESGKRARVIPTWEGYGAFIGGPRRRKNLCRWPKGSKIQSIAFKKDHWDPRSAKKWLKDHKYKTPMVDVRKSEYRFRQLPPETIVKEHYASIPFGDEAFGIRAIIGEPMANPLKLLTKELANRFPAIGTTEPDQDPIVQVKWFSPWTGWEWYGIEGAWEEGFEHGKDFLMYGFIKGQVPELGYFTLSQLNIKKGNVPLVERDKWWEPRPLSQVQAEIRRNNPGQPYHPNEFINYRGKKGPGPHAFVIDVLPMNRRVLVRDLVDHESFSEPYEFFAPYIPKKRNPTKAEAQRTAQWHRQRGKLARVVKVSDGYDAFIDGLRKLRKKKEKEAAKRKKRAYKPKKKPTKERPPKKKEKKPKEIRFPLSTKTAYDIVNLRKVKDMAINEDDIIAFIEHPEEEEDQYDTFYVERDLRGYIIFVGHQKPGPGKRYTGFGLAMPTPFFERFTPETYTYDELWDLYNNLDYYKDESLELIGPGLERSWEATKPPKPKKEKKPPKKKKPAKKEPKPVPIGSLIDYTDLYGEHVGEGIIKDVRWCDGEILYLVNLIDIHRGPTEMKPINADDPGFKILHEVTDSMAALKAWEDRWEQRILAKDEPKIEERKKKEALAKEVKKAMKKEKKKEGKLKASDIPAIVKKIMPKMQQKVIRGSEEHWDIIDRLEKEAEAVPKLYSQNGKSKEDTPVYLHYFYGQSDWFITEWDGKDTYFGQTILNGDSQMSEMGYIHRPELIDHGKIELDFFWHRKSLQAALEEADPEYFGKKEPDERILLGRNSELQDIYADASGNRFIVEGGIKISAPRLLHQPPYSAEELYSRGSEEFLTVEELRQFKVEPVIEEIEEEVKPPPKRRGRPPKKPVVPEPEIPKAPPKEQLSKEQLAAEIAKGLKTLLED